MSEISESLKKIREGKERKFKQTIDLVIVLKNIDLKKPDNRFKKEISFPHGTGKVPTCGLILENLIPKAEGLENTILIKRSQIETYGKNKKEFKKIANKCKFFAAEAPLMPLVGKSLGQVLAPKGLMPKPIPPTADLKNVIAGFSKSIRIILKTTPTISVPIGTEEMNDDQIEENANLVIKTVVSSLPKGKSQIRKGILKTSMGKPVKFVIK